MMFASVHQNECHFAAVMLREFVFVCIILPDWSKQNLSVARKFADAVVRQREPFDDSLTREGVSHVPVR